MIRKIFNFQTKTVTFSALLLSISALISGILGLIRDRLLAGRFGASLELDVYFAAFRVPDFVYNILILGGLIVAFLPLFSEYFSRNKEEAWQMANYVLNAFLIFLISISFILFILTPWLIKWLFPGFGPEHYKLAVPLIRLLFLSPIFFGISNLLSGILQYFNRFFIYGLTPILYNLGIIFGILFLVPYFGIFGVGMGVVFGAFLHMAIQIPTAINCGFSYKFLLDFKYPAIKRIFNLMIPRVFGVAAQQINLIVITAIASTITAGSIAIFSISNNFQSLPIGIIGISFAVAVFPTLSRTWTQNQKKEFLGNFSSIFRQILFFIIPISILIFLLRTQIIEIIYRTGKFGLENVQLTSACLGIFTFSIFAQSLIPLLSRAFFSFQDTKTPTLITISAVLLNIILSLSFIWLLKFPNTFSNFFIEIFSLLRKENTVVLGLPLAFSISAIFQFILLYFAFKRKTK
ncbi:MAG: murein biosynthesis integral membrane protein MurJ [bacterium]|nr:murein biosynthesis integral membrane protein MurJ [bacterium]